MPISILIFLGLAFALVFLLRLAKIGTLLAFLAAGIIAGPGVLKLWEVSEIWTFLGEIGIIFLWFSMGLELNIKRLWQMRQNIFGFGAAQVLMVAVMLFPILFGFTGWTIISTVMIALLLAMSSTSGDLQILADRNELQTGMGRQTFSILLFQDLLAIPLLAMLPVFAGNSFHLGADVIDVVVLTVSLVLGAVIVGRLLLNPLMKAVSRLKSKEAFLMAVLLNIVLWAVVFEFIGLPPAIGAFIAGMLLSETVYRHQIQADISPYQIMFLSFFFIALGMGLNLPLLAQNWWLIILGVAALIIVKFTAIYIVARVRHIHSHEAFMIALILAQGGEFGLLILQTMKTNGIEAIPGHHSELLMAVIVVSMMITPILLAIYDRLYAAGKLFHFGAAKKINKKQEIAEIKPEVIICGFGRVGQTIAKMLQAEKIPYVALDMNADSVVIGRINGYNVFYGDTTSQDILKEIGLAQRRTKAVVIALDNAAVAKRTVRAVHDILPRVKIFARARNMQESRVLQATGALVALPETIESSFALGTEVLENFGIKQQKIENLLSNLRDNNYSALEGIK
ncbi:MAG: cation:proton antiporter [Rickettsiales bacterium]|jgi:Kef-type K+ transport system membrane component KefB/voltage-gated potassium channel Kch|nr:cation:proton antiporter [Rickettsiales bacterium]